MRLPLALPFVLAIAACGGSPKPAAPKAPEPVADPIPRTAGPECKLVAEHIMQVVPAEDPETRVKFGEVARTHCETDKWSDEARSCLNTIESEPEAEGCLKLLSDQQRKAFMADASKLDPGSKGDAETAGAAPPPPPPAKARTTRGATKKESSPPAKSSDPCQGGE